LKAIAPSYSQFQPSMNTPLSIHIHRYKSIYNCRYRYSWKYIFISLYA